MDISGVTATKTILWTPRFGELSERRKNETYFEFPQRIELEEVLEIFLLSMKCRYTVRRKRYSNILTVSIRTDGEKRVPVY